MESIIRRKKRLPKYYHKLFHFKLNIFFLGNKFSIDYKTLTVMLSNQINKLVNILIYSVSQ